MFGFSGLYPSSVRSTELVNYFKILKSRVYFTSE